jgi:ZIP family zinc transporter
MQTAIIFGLIGGLSLLFGAMFGLIFKVGQKNIARFMAFGSGVLICALTFGLMEEAFKHGGFDAVIIGFLTGGIVFIVGDYIIHRVGGRRHKRKQLMPSKTDSASGRAITLGAMLDGVPESIALGISIATGQAQGILMVVAITLSNFPEGISSVEGLKREGFTNKKIYIMWSLVAFMAVGFTIISFVYLSKLNPNTLGIIEAFAAGAILAMLADTTMPEAYEEGGFSIGFLTILGFLTAFLVSRFK